MQNGRLIYRFEDDLELLCNNRLSDNVWRKLIKDFNMPVSFVNHLGMCHILEMTLKEGLGQGSFEVFKWVSQLCLLPQDQQEAFVGLTRDVMEAMIKYVLDADGYSNYFNRIDLQQLMPVENLNIPSGDIYTRPNIGKTYLSLDLSSAAFQAFRYWDVNFGDKYSRILPKNADTYNYWVSHTMVTEMDMSTMSDAKRVIYRDKDLRQAVVDYIYDSKQMRQVIFGKTNPKRIQHVEKYMVQQMVKSIDNEFGIKPVRLNNDEILYEITSGWSDDLITGVRNAVKNDRSTNWHVTIFNLDAYQLIQRVDYMGEQLINNGPVVFVKGNKEGLDEDFVWVAKPVSFKCLPTRFAFAFEMMYKGASEDSYEYFLNLPVIADGFATWVVNPNTSWKIKKVTNE